MKHQILSLLLLSAMFLVATTAQAKRATGNSGVEDQLKFKSGDESGNDVKALKTELLVIKSEKRALAQLQRLQTKYTGTRMEPEILFRLAELYMRRARSERFFEVHKSTEVVSFVPSLVKDASEATEVRKAVAIYQKLEADFPNFRSMDIVIFNNAYANQQLNEDKEAEKLFALLVRVHAESPLVPDAYLAIGEINYARRNFTFALEKFKNIRKFPQARAYPYGLYKAAWCHYNLQDTESGLKQLEEVVTFGRAMMLAKTDAKLDLRKEALGDMALFYADTRKAELAVDYFRDQAKELDAAPFVMRLVELYKRASKLNETDFVLKDVITKMPKSEVIAQVYEELVWNSERMKKRPDAVAQLGAFDVWCDAQKNPKNPVAEKACHEKISDASQKLAAKWHASWKKQGGPEDLALAAEKGYRLYMKNAAVQATDLPAVRFSFAELLFARGQFLEASENYAAIDGYNVSGRVQEIEPKIAHDAAYGAIVALEKSNGAKWNDTDEKRFVVLSDVYQRRFPKGEYALDLRFKRAFIAYEKERFDEAAPQFKKIGWSDLDAATTPPEKVLKAQDLYLDILNIKKDYKALKEAARQLLPRSQGTRTGQIEKIYREAFFSEIQQTEEKGDLLAAVEAYKKFALENASSDLAPKAWWNASQLQFKLGDAQGGANTCYQMHRLFPQSTNGRDCLTKAAQTFESMARLDLAARVLLNLALVETGKQDHWREVAADFFALSGSKDRAISMYSKLADDRTNRPEQIALYEKAAALARETNDLTMVTQIEAKFTQMNVEPHASRLVMEQAEMALGKNDLTKAFNLAKRVIGKESLPKDVLARARLVQAKVLEDEYRHQSIKARAERIGTVLAIKTEKLEKAQKAFQSAIRYGDAATSVMAFRRLADCYLDYSASVKNMPAPNGVSGNDLIAFKAELEQLTVPMEEKGIEAMNQALEVAKKAQLRDGQISDLQLELNKLNMKSNASPIVTVNAPSIYVPLMRAPAGTESKL